MGYSAVDMNDRDPHPTPFELAERARQFRLVLDNIDQPICYYGYDLVFHFVNRQYAEFIGLPEAKILGRRLPEVIGESVFEEVREYIAQALSGLPVTYERDRAWPGRGVRRVRITLLPDVGSTGIVHGLYAVGYDIDEMKRTQEALREAERHVRLFTDNTPEPLAYLDASQRFSFVNQAYIDGVKLPRERIIGQEVAAVLGGEAAAYLQPYIDRARAGERTIYERLRPAADGKPRWIRGLLVPDYDTEKQFKGIYIVVHDIHDLKLAQASVQRINWVLSSHIENTPMAVMEWDKDFRLIRWSQRAEAIFGWTAGEVLGSSLRHWKLVFDADVIEVDAIIEGMLMGDRSSTTSTHRNNRKDGSVIWCEWHNSVLRDDSGEILSILSFAQDVSDRVDAQEKLEAMATHDALTGLPNRVLLHLQLAQTLDRARHRQRQVAVLFIDLDRFKNVNDSLGHRMGDELLRMIGRRLGLALRKGDFLARLGGDEFTVLLEDLNDAEDAVPVAAKLLEVIQQPYWVHGHAVHISASIGVSIFPDDGDDPDTLLKNADVAMYRAKDAGKNVYQFFAREMGARQQEQMALETALRWAVKNEELEIRFQPKLEIASGRIVGAEALLRWNDPILGEVPPSRFIPLAEESGLIEVLGDWVLKQACGETQLWAAAGLEGMTIAINLSVRQFRDAGFAARIQKIFADTKVDPHRVEFEVTETSVLYDAETVGRVLQLERELGVRVAIDDFGTGYSSLVHLKRLPIDTLKIDQSFIRDITTDPDDKAITAAIIALAHSLALDVVAEGVESAEQLAFLAERGCNYYQGHHFSAPLDSAAFIALALRHRNAMAQAQARSGVPIV